MHTLLFLFVSDTFEGEAIISEAIAAAAEET
jgi:hypothetical protein